MQAIHVVYGEVQELNEEYKHTLTELRYVEEILKTLSTKAIQVDLDKRKARCQVDKKRESCSQHQAEFEHLSKELCLYSDNLHKQQLVVQELEREMCSFSSKVAEGFR
jgi:chromosome segregation ATPase